MDSHRKPSTLLQDIAMLQPGTPSLPRCFGRDMQLCCRHECPKRRKMCSKRKRFTLFMLITNNSRGILCSTQTEIVTFAGYKQSLGHGWKALRQAIGNAFAGYKLAGAPPNTTNTTDNGNQRTTAHCGRQRSLSRRGRDNGGIHRPHARLRH